MFVDTNILANFERIGQLDALLAANRLIIITPEVYEEAVHDAIATGDPQKMASGQRIEGWVNANKSQGNVRIDPINPDRALKTGKDAGEESISADVGSLNGQGDPVVLSDDRSMGLQRVAGSAMPALTGNYYLGSLLIGGAITPNDYFQMSAAGAAAGFNQRAFPSDTSSVYLNGREYGLIIDGLQQGTVRYTNVGSSSITLDGRPPAYSAPYERVGIQNGEIVRFNSDGSRKIDLNENEVPSDQTAATNPWQDFGALSLQDQPGGFNQYDSGNPFLAAPMLTSASMFGPSYSSGTAGIFPPFADGSAGPGYPAAPPDAQFPSLLPFYAGQPGVDPANFLGLSPARRGFDSSFGLLDGTIPLLLSRPSNPLGDLLADLLQGPRSNGSAAPGSLLDRPPSNPTGYDWLAPPLAPSWTMPQADPAGSAAALSAPAPQIQVTPQQVPASPPPFSVPVPPALLPLARHFFPQGPRYERYSGVAFDRDLR